MDRPMRHDAEFLNQQRRVGDALADQLVKEIFERNEATSLYEALRLSPAEVVKAHSKNAAIDFLKQPVSNPIWFDKKKIMRGQSVFEHHAVHVMSLLGLLSLPYCYAAYPGNKALYLTEKMRKSPGKRLAETGEFTLGVLRKGSLQENGEGLIHINKTRLIHAVARHHLQMGNWNDDWGIPINQEDMAGTNLAFSYLILTGLQRSGILLSDREKEDFLFVWKYVGYQLGISEDLLSNDFQEARLLAETIKARTVRKTEEGITLAKELIDYYKKVIPHQQGELLESQMRLYLGEDVANYLGLANDTAQQKFLTLVNGVKEIRNMFSVPHNQLPQLMANIHQMKATVAEKNL